MTRLLFISFFSLSLLLVGCEKESLNLTEEIPSTPDPVIVETENDSDFFFLRMPSGETVSLEGEAVVDDNGLIGLVTSGSSAASCEEGFITLTLDGNEPGFFLVIRTVPEQTVFLAGGSDIEGFSDGFAFSSTDCAGESASLEITTLTDDRIAGVYAADFFTSPQVFDCENLTSIGTVEVVFDVPLTACE